MRTVFIGAGSVVFTRNLTRDVLTFDELGDSEIVLMDVDAERLSRAHKLVSRIAETAGAPAQVIATTDRRQALKGADYVVVTIQVGGLDQYDADIAVPQHFGVSQCVGDTLGPGGIFRGLRHLAVFDGLIEDMADLCPRALVLQYSNPMAILTWRAALAGLRVVGLCHSVQGTARLLAEYCEVPLDELNYWVAGINHQAWFLTLEHDGRDLYPRLRLHLDNPESLGQEPVRLELMRRFGYFVTESSGHASEYLPISASGPTSSPRWWRPSRRRGPTTRRGSVTGTPVVTWRPGDSRNRGTRRRLIARSPVPSQSSSGVQTSTVPSSFMPSRPALSFASTATCSMRTS